MRVQNFALHSEEGANMQHIIYLALTTTDRFLIEIVWSHGSHGYHKQHIGDRFISTIHSRNKLRMESATIMLLFTNRYTIREGIVMNWFTYCNIMYGPLYALSFTINSSRRRCHNLFV